MALSAKRPPGPHLKPAAGNSLPLPQAVPPTAASSAFSAGRNAGQRSASNSTSTSMAKLMPRASAGAIVSSIHGLSVQSRRRNVLDVPQQAAETPLLLPLLVYHHLGFANAEPTTVPRRPPLPHSSQRRDAGGRCMHWLSDRPSI